MKGRNLNDVQMKDTTHVYAGQILSVGLKSTDLVERLFDNSLHGLNSVKTEGSSHCSLLKILTHCQSLVRLDM